jgi:hypothetical protein
MAKRIYFCFHYRDVVDFRANVVRNHWMTKPDREAAGFFDWSLWESAEKTGSTAVKRLINGGLDGSSVTCILIGSNTYERPWVRYEVMKSFRRGNRIFGVHINSIRGKNQLTKPLGPNPLKYLGVTFSESGVTRTLHEIRNGEWQEYDEIGGSACYQGNPVAERYRGKGFNFGRWYPVYDWAADEGYVNFVKWVG